MGLEHWAHTLPSTFPFPRAVPLNLARPRSRPVTRAAPEAGRAARRKKSGSSKTAWRKAYSSTRTTHCWTVAFSFIEATVGFFFYLFFFYIRNLAVTLKQKEEPTSPVLGRNEWNHLEVSPRGTESLSEEKTQGNKRVISHS